MEAREKTARGLGWFSIALGLTEVIAPRGLGGFFGMSDGAGLIRAFGFREIAAGVGILAYKRPAPGLWARFAGDFLDLAALARGLSSDNPKRSRVAVAIATIIGITIIDGSYAWQLSK